MANHKSAIKRMRQNKKRRIRNGALRSEARSAVKKVRLALESGKKEEAQAALKSAVSILDKTASKGVHHKKNASRRVSRLARQVAAMS